MKASAIRKLAKEFDLETLRNAEEYLLDEQDPGIPIEGEDEGDKVTNLNGAIWVKEQMEQNGTELKTEVRNFTERVRNSISSE